MKFTRGFIVGSLLGTFAGMLVLPYMNDNTKKQLNNTTKTIFDKTTGLVGEMKDKH